MTGKTEAERHARENPEQAAKELRESEQRAAVPATNSRRRRRSDEEVT